MRVLVVSAPQSRGIVVAFVTFFIGGCIMRTRIIWLIAVFLIVFMGFGPSHGQEVVNILENGGFESGAMGPWITYGGVTTEVVEVLVGAAVPEDPIEGDYCLHLDVTTLGANNWDVGLKHGGHVFEEGRQYTLSAFVKCSQGTLDIRFKPERDGTPFEGFPEQIFTMTQEWTEFTVTTPVFTETIDPAAITFHIGFAEGDLWFDGARFYEGEYVPPAFKKKLIAEDPSPEDGVVDVPHDTALSWAPGPFADTHNVYFGKVFDDVNNADTTNTLDVLVRQGQAETTYDPEGLLEFSQTYYWRIDEVNAPPDSTVFKGDLWSFTVEPFVYPVENVTATSSSNTQDMGPENTVDGSGLNAADQHSTEPTDMWLSSVLGPQPTWIQYEFDKACKLFEMWVWNSNQLLESLFGLGAKGVTVEYSEDGSAWTSLGDVEFAKAPGTADYMHGITIDMSGVLAKYVKLTISSNWGGLLDQYGLSEVRFFYIPVQAREPKPTSEGKGVARDVILDWRGGREAALHEVYFSQDKEAVTDGTALADTVTESSYLPGSLDFGQTYYWKINEVNDTAGTPSWEGDVWSFSTIEYFVIDDFESYNDLNEGEPGSNRIYLAWIDGFDNPLINGSTVGHLDPPFAEKTIVHGGSQSMPMTYDNAVGKSEATLTLTSNRDWTFKGLNTLTIWFQGSAGNAAENLYVALNGSAVVNHDNPNAAQEADWTEWNIDLQAFADQGVNLANVTSITIGLGNRSNPVAGGAGMMYFDDIRIYAR